MDLIMHVWPESSKLKLALNSNNVFSITSPCVIHEFNGLNNFPLNSYTLNSECIKELKSLLSNNNLESALGATTCILRQFQYPDPTSVKSVSDLIIYYEVWSVRFQLMLALSKFNEMIEEMTRFKELDEPETYFQFYPNLKSEYQGSFIPFTFRLLHAEAYMHHANSSHISIVRALKLSRNLSEAIDILKNKSPSVDKIELFRKRKNLADDLLASCFFRIKEYHYAFSIYDDLVEKATYPDKCKLLKLLTRLAISIGDEKRMNKYLKELIEIENEKSDTIMHKCFKGVFFGDYNYSCDRMSALLNHPAIQSDVSQFRVLHNNLAVSHLYTGNVSQSLKTLLEYDGVIMTPLESNLNVIADLASNDPQNLKSTFKKHKFIQVHNH